MIDVGINKVDDPKSKNGYRLVGDVDFENVKDKCAYITPVPGGRAHDHRYVVAKYFAQLSKTD